jgi:hypothetical protein
MTPAQHEAKKAYQRAWYAKRYAEIMADPQARAELKRRKRDWKRKNKETARAAQPAVNQEIYKTHGAFAALFSNQEAA